MPFTNETAISEKLFPNGVTTAFPFSFKAEKADEVVALDKNGNIIPVALYSVVLGAEEGGTLTFAVAPTAEDYPHIFIASNPSFDQMADFDNAGPSFNPEAITRAFDRAALRDLRQQREIDRGLKVPFGETPIPFASGFNLATNGSLLQIEDNEVVAKPFPETETGQVLTSVLAIEARLNAAQGEIFAVIGSTEVPNFATGENQTDNGDSFHVYDPQTKQVKRYINGTSVDANDWVYAFPVDPVVTPATTLSPAGAWDGTLESGFSSIPSDPTRSTAKPVLRPLFVPGQTITDNMLIGVAAGANDSGGLATNFGTQDVIFYFEGSSQRVSPSFRSFTRSDGSTYNALGWWVTLAKPSGTEGSANLYVEAIARDNSMQNRVMGPYKFALYEEANRYDLDLTVAADGSGDHTTMAAAFTAIATASADRPRIRVIDGGNYSLAGGAVTHNPAFWCDIEATEAVTFVEPVPALAFDFTRLRPIIGSLRFKGSNITHDFVETLVFDPLQGHGYPWYDDGAKIRQSRGREDLWRGMGRNIIPSLFIGTVGSGAVYLTHADIQDVNDAGDKTALAIGCVVTNTWGDLFQGALCIVGNKVFNHSSAFYYTNVDALNVQYTGSASTASVERRSGSFRLYEDGAEIDRFTLDSSEQGYRDDTNYRVASLVAWIDGKAGWSATLLDDTRAAFFISEPGTTNGSNFGPIDAKTVQLTLPTHIDIHSDLFQVPNSTFMENVYVAQNETYDCDMQNYLIVENVPGNTKDFVIWGNTHHNRTGGPDEDLQSAAGQGSHMVFVGNTLANQRVSMPNVNHNADGYSIVANNVAVRFAPTGGLAGHPDVIVKNNHMTDDAIDPVFGLTSTATGTTFGGDHTTLFVDAANGNFAPAGDLLTNLAVPVMPNDQNGAAFLNPGAKGALV